MTTIDDDLMAEFAAIAHDTGCELIHAEFKGGTLRVFIERLEGGVTIDDCQAVSKQLSALLDVHDFGRKRYVLEVSSPGLDRQLYGPRDYRRFQGSLARVTFFDPDRAKKTVVGRLTDFRDDEAGRQELTLTEEPSGQELVIELRDVQKARLEIEL